MAKCVHCVAYDRSSVPVRNRTAARSLREENQALGKYLIYSANMIMYKVVQVAGQIGGRQLT